MQQDVELIYPWIPIGTRIINTGDYQVKFRLPMSKGQVGQDVVLVQWALRAAGFCPGEAGGVFNQETEAAVRELQRFFGLEPTGVVDETSIRVDKSREGKNGRQTVPLSLCLILFANCFGAARKLLIRTLPWMLSAHHCRCWDVELLSFGSQSKSIGRGGESPGGILCCKPRHRCAPEMAAVDRSREELARVLRDGNPPDIFADWQGIARSDHLLQIPASTWLDKEHLTAAGKNMSTHEGKIWSWPLMFWPLGLLVMESRCGLSMEELEAVIRSPWDWPQFAQWLESKGLQLLANDWESEFAAQALVASTGRSWGQWGGQELHQVFTGLKLVVDGGLVHKGRDTQILQGKMLLEGPLLP